MKRPHTSNGFTLIELLVVIAIIAILSTIVLASLNSARAKGADAAIKSNLANMRAQAEIYFDSTGANSYGASTNSCTLTPGSLFIDPIITNARVAAEAASGNPAVCKSSEPTGSPIATRWAMSVPLKSNSAQSWCVDSTGNSTILNAVTGPMVIAVCP